MRLGQASAARSARRTPVSDQADSGGGRVPASVSGESAVLSHRKRYVDPLFANDHFPRPDLNQFKSFDGLAHAERPAVDDRDRVTADKRALKPQRLRFFVNAECHGAATVALVTQRGRKPLEETGFSFTAVAFRKRSGR
jgi:hypothetical protein